jgi:hypothetical protein
MALLCNADATPQLGNGVQRMVIYNSNQFVYRLNLEANRNVVKRFVIELF